jgi:hypothetical protein
LLLLLLLLLWVPPRLRVVVLLLVGHGEARGKAKPPSASSAKLVTC